MRAIVLGCAVGWSLAVATAAELPPRPNVLLILIDDHAAQLHSAMGGNGVVATPNLQRLAARSVWFTRAYADSPACCPSRTALLTGIHTARSGVYYNSQAYRRSPGIASTAQTLPGSFLRHGYTTVGFGKIAHNGYLEDDEKDYSPGCYKWFDNPDHVRHPEKALLRFALPGSVTTMWTDAWTWGVLPDEWDRDDPERWQQDTQQAERAAQFLRQKQDRPFFLACGFWRPHLTWNVPRRYYDRFPLSEIRLPEGYRAGDLEDIPPAARWLATHRGEHEWITTRDLWRKCLRGYYAAISYVDEQIGRVLDALEASEHRQNTIIIFASDNGWHTGEKDHWTKFLLSEQASRVVLGIAVPGVTPGVVDQPVGLIDLYPTLLGLCRLPEPTSHRLDGMDLSAILRSPQSALRGAPVLTTFGRGNHSLRDSRYRYTRYRNGSEELYDHQEDPFEWENLATEDRFAAVKQRLRSALPAHDAPEVEYASPAAKARDINRWSDAVLDR